MITERSQRSTLQTIIIIEYTEQSLKEHGMKISVKKRQVLKISRGKETSVKIHTGRKEII